MSSQRDSASPYDRRHRANITRYGKQIDRLFDTLCQEAARLGIRTGLEEGLAGFSFDRFPATKKQASRLLARIRQEMETAIAGGIRDEWELSEEKNAAIIEHLLEDTGIPREVAESMKPRNADALEAFQKRRTRGLALSDRVWNVTSQAMGEVETAIGLSLSSGMDAPALSRKVRGLLKNPSEMWRRYYVTRTQADGTRRKEPEWRRRVVGEDGKAHFVSEPLSHPGRGVYRSSYRNALRLAVTETNMAYHEADTLAWMQSPACIGIEVTLSNNHTCRGVKGMFFDICDELAGKYPRDFKFTGWHPFCRCVAVPITASKEEFVSYLQDMIAGMDVSGVEFKGTVKDMPACFTKWCARNKERIERMSEHGTLPYFIKDNEGKIMLPDDGAGAKPASKLDELANAIGVKLGSPMEHEQADMKHPNPHYTEGEGYRINCQSTVVAYELRRRGLPVEAYGRATGCMADKLRYNTRAAWLDADGNIPKPIICKQEVKKRTVDRRGAVRTTYTSANDVFHDFMRQTSEAGRYHLSWSWQGKDTGHIITMETFKDGARRFYDPQTGLEAKNILPWIMRNNKVAFDLKKGIEAYRVDTLQPNSLIVEGVVKKAGTTGIAPMMTAEQKAWWAKNVEKKTLGGVNGTPLSSEEKLRRKEIERKAKELLRGVEMRHANFDKPITISGGKINEWINQPFTKYAAKNEALLRLPQLIEKAAYIGWGRDKHDARVEMHLFETKIGETTSWIIVRKSQNGESVIHSISDSPSILSHITHHAK